MGWVGAAETGVVDPPVAAPPVGADVDADEEVEAPADTEVVLLALVALRPPPPHAPSTTAHTTMTAAARMGAAP
ncbi:MAG: hypothetical protein JOZ04_16100 [Acidimicrobiia bacterium]|nr:hypothetical protein [Acidimicrobiia bacterium]